MQDPSNAIVERAVALATDGRSREDAARELADLVDGDSGPLEAARMVFVHRLSRRTDDYEASKALTVVNAAIAAVGWHGDHTWTPRPHKLFRLS